MEQATAQTLIAVIALLLWPVIALWLYTTRSVFQATLWTILGGFLLLPVGAGIKLAAGIPRARQGFDTGARGTWRVRTYRAPSNTIFGRIRNSGSPFARSAHRAINHFRT